MAPRRTGGAAQLSPAQQRLWFLHRLEPESAAYNMYNVWRLRGPLAPDALRAAIGDLAARHEILRTRYPDDDGRPAVTVEPASLVLEEIELHGAEDEAERLVAARVNAPFDLTAAPPVRIGLIRLAEDDHVLCLVLHHIAGDGWSLNILRDDLAALYAARRHGTAAALAEPLVQYAEIGPEYWNRDRDAALEYWRAQLAEPTVLDLPTDRPRPRRSAHRGGIHPFRLPDEAARGLEAVGRQYGATLFMVLLTAYQVLLSRHSGQDDILVGTPAAGRDRVEFEPVVGYFTRTLVLRAEVAADLPFDELLLRTRRTVLDALDHQDVPFEDLLAALGVERDPARTPLFQTMAILHSQDEDAAGDTFADLGFAFFDAGYRQAKFDLMLEAWRDEDGLSLLLDYDAELFDASTVATLAQRFVVLLGAIVAQPSRPVADLPILTAADQRFLDAHAHARRRSGPAGARADRPRRGSHPGRGRRQLRRREAHLRAAVRTGRRAGEPPRRTRRRRRLSQPVHGHGRRTASGLVRGRRLPAPRPGVPGRAPRIHDRGQRRVNSCHRNRGHRRSDTGSGSTVRVRDPRTRSSSTPSSRWSSTLPPTSSTPRARPASRRAWRSRTPTWRRGCAGWWTRTNSAPTTGSCSSPR